MRKPKFKVGDKVKVLRASTDAEHDLWGDAWVNEMKVNIGEVLTIDHVCCNDWQKKYEYCKYMMEKCGYAYPEFVLQKVCTKGKQLLFSFME